MPDNSEWGEVWADAIAAAPEEPVDWIWHGLLAPGNLTLLTGQWFAGKTTLLSILLGLRVAGGELAGLAVRPGKALIITEEPRPLWAERARKHQFGAGVCFFFRPFQTIPTQEEWLGLIERALKLHRKHGLDLVVLDPLAPFLRSENDARGMLEALLPLGRLLSAGVAGLLLHHPGRAERPLGQAARGSGALLGHVDISAELRFPPGGEPLTRRRRLFAQSRHAASPRLLTLELDEAGTAYQLVTETPEERFEAEWETVRLVLAGAPQKLTRQDVLQEWPPGLGRPEATTVWRWLSRAAELGWVRWEGGGSKGDPFRYWLPEREAVWRQDPLSRLVQEQREALKLPFESLSERKEKLRQAGEATGAAGGTE